MQRILLEAWRKKYFTVGSPSLQSLKKAFDQGDIAGKRLGELRIVYCDDNYEPIEIPQNTAPKKARTGNAIADAILNKYGIQ